MFRLGFFPYIILVEFDSIVFDRLMKIAARIKVFEIFNIWKIWKIQHCFSLL